MSKYNDYMKIDKTNCPDGHYGIINEDVDLICPHCGYIMESAYHAFAPKKKGFVFR